MVLTAGIALAAADVRACSGHGSIAGATLDVTVSGDVDGDGQFEAFVGLEDTLVEPTATTTCVAGIGLGQTGSPLPPGVIATRARIEVVHRVTGVRQAVAEFDFLADAETTSGLIAGSGPVGPAGTNPLFTSATWFGFSAQVEPFLLSLGPDEFFQLGFDLEGPNAALPFSVVVQFAAGEGETNGSPLFTGAHPAVYYTTGDPLASFAVSVIGVSPVALLIVLGLTGTFLASQSRR